MKLEITNDKKSPSTNKGGKKPKLRHNGKVLFNPLDYAYEENEKVFINEEGKKQIRNLNKGYYRVIAIRMVDLNDMLVNVMDLDPRDDENIRNPYLAHHFSPLNPKDDNEESS